MTSKRAKFLITSAPELDGKGSYKEMASKVFDAVSAFEKRLGHHAVPRFWIIDVEGRAHEDVDGDYDILCDDDSQIELGNWACCGGRIELMRPQGPDDLVVVRLVCPESGQSTFGVSFPSETGRRFVRIGEDLAGNTEKLRAYFKSMKARLSGIDAECLEFRFRDAPCQLTRPFHPVRRYRWGAP